MAGSPDTYIKVGDDGRRAWLIFRYLEEGTHEDANGTPIRGYYWAWGDVTRYEACIQRGADGTITTITNAIANPRDFAHATLYHSYHEAAAAAAVSRPPLPL